MAKRSGWTGRILCVDLSRRETACLPTSDYLPDHIGGRMLGAALAWEMLRPGMDPFDEDSPLMFLTGPLAGTLAPSSGRVTICGLAPQSSPTGWFSRASMGGDLSGHLKGAGYDGLVITGRADAPCYLWIREGEAEILEAGDLWGRGIMATQEELHRRHGARAQVATIGPAGERRSRIASIGINEGSAAGQGGFGAVMGAKNLKAVAVLGGAPPPAAHPQALRAFVRAIAREHAADHRRRMERFPRWGPPGGRRVPCSRGCLFGCARRHEDVPGVVFPERRYSGVVQCTAIRFPGAEGFLWDLGFEAGFELNMAANDWGINHWDLMKGLFPWIAMCQRAGLLPDIGGRPVEPDAPRFWYEVLEAIATGRGPMADVVGDGGWRAIRRTGLLPEEARQLYTGWGYANHWDGRGPRGNRITYPFWLVAALMWMADTRDPMGSAHAYVQNMTGASPFGQGILTWEQLQGIAVRLYGRPEPMDPLSAYEGKAEAALFHIRRSVLKDSLTVCDRVFPRLFTTTSDDGIPRADGVEGPDYEARLYSLVTGRETGPEELDLAAERALALERREQIRDFGRTRADEAHVLRFFCETDEEYPNPMLGERRRADPARLEALASAFYALRGWDPRTGSPDGADDRAPAARPVAPTRADTQGS